MTVSALIWVLIAAIAVADSLLLIVQHLSVAMPWSCLLGTGCLGALAFLYQHRAPPLARLAMAGAQLVAFSNAVALLTYAAMAATPFPLADPWLARADAALGFDWVGWLHFVDAHASLHLAFSVAYASVSGQGLLLIGYLSIVRPERAQALLLAGILAMIIITPVMALLPAAGARYAYGVGGVESWTYDVLALHAHTMRAINHFDGIVAFPSYHTVLAVIFMHAARGRRWFPPVLILNLVMIGSVLTEGAHYAVDMLGGLVTACIAIAAAEWLIARLGTRPISAPAGFAKAPAAMLP
ncbi:MAG TPA: phosphatase PAP2 family protein [Rhodopila sp.]|nr:phosphatase PAP2 family protein [Rhodopila sp.]